MRKPAVALIGDAKPILRRLLDVLPAHNAQARLAQGRDGGAAGAAGASACDKLAPQLAFLDAIRAELPEDGIFVDEVTQIGFAARLAFPVYKPRTFLSPGYQDNLGWGFATALGAQDARRDVPVVSISGDGGFMFTANEMATAMRHRIPLVAIVFTDGAFGNVRRIQEERYGNRLIASDLANPDFVRFAESFGAAAERARNAGGAARGARRALRAPRRADPDRGAGRAVALALGVHPHAARCGADDMPRSALATAASTPLCKPRMELDHHDRANWPPPARGWRAIPSSPSTPSSCARPPTIRCCAWRRWRAPTRPWWSTRSRPASTSSRSSS